MAEQSMEIVDENVAKAKQSIDRLVQEAQKVSVGNARDAELATEFLAQIAREKKGHEENRKFFVKPLNDQVKRINGRWKEMVGPLDEADAIVRQKVLDYRAEQRRIQEMEQVRLDEERRAREAEAEEQRRKEEAEARAAREAAAREAAAAEAAARAAEEERRRQIAREADGIARRAAGATDDQLRGAAERQDAFGDAARTELSRRAAAEAARQAAEDARRREEDARAAEEAAKSRPVEDVPTAVAAPAERLASASGSVTEKKRWVFEVVDELKVPRRFLKIDEQAIRAAVREGAREIAGVKIEQVDELAVRTRR